MIDKYKVLNNEKIQFDRYNEVKTDNEKMKNIIKSKLKSRKQINKKLIAASISATLVLGSVALSKDTTWAYIDILVNHIESFLGKDYSEFDKYKFEGNQSIEKNGLVLNLGDVMLDDGELIISLSMDYSNFDFKENGINKKDLMPDLPIVTMGDISFPGQGGGIMPRDVKDKKKKEFLYRLDLTRIDTDGDGIVDTDFEILDNLEKNKDYNLKIQFKDFDIGESKTEKGLLLSKSLGDWEFNTTLNSSNISNDIKVINIDKTIDTSEGNKKCKLKISEIRISPVSSKVKMEVEGNTSDEYFLSIKDNNGKILNKASGVTSGGISGISNNTVYENFEFNGTEKKIIITPIVYSDNKEKYLEDDKIEIEIPQK